MTRLRLIICLVAIFLSVVIVGIILAFPELSNPPANTPIVRIVPNCAEDEVIYAVGDYPDGPLQCLHVDDVP